jgi:hypothetical protein
MKLPITIEYQNGTSETYTAQPPEWAKWEMKTGNIISQAQDKIGISDLMFLAYSAMKREGGGKPVKPFEAWCETVAEVLVGADDPKVTSGEA